MLALGLMLLRGLVEVDVHCDVHLGWLRHHLRLEPALRALPIVLKRLPDNPVILGHLSVVVARRVREGTVRVGFRCLPLALELGLVAMAVVSVVTTRCSVAEKAHNVRVALEGTTTVLHTC